MPILRIPGQELLAVLPMLRQSVASSIAKL